MSWGPVAHAMAECVRATAAGARIAEVVKFAQDCMHQIFRIMVGLKEIDGNCLRSFTALQAIWKVRPPPPHCRLSGVRARMS